jgi:predicted amidohydrolase YtcJ
MKKLFCNGTVVTMDEKKPLAEAVLAEDGKITAVGERKALREAAPDAAEVDLCGGTLLPSFIDPHSHFSSVASGLLQVSIEDCGCFDEVRKKIGAFRESAGLKPGEWVMVRGYDQDRLAERRHLTAAFLDGASPDNPVIVQHKCGHTGVCSSEALRLFGVTENTADPAGGRYGRDHDGTLNGYLEENAFFENIRKVPLPQSHALLNGFCRAQEKYASYGITTVQEGMMVAQMIPLHQLLLSGDVLKLDLVSYPEFPAAEQLYSAFSDYAGNYRNHYRLGGIKIFLDGSPQERTAWMRPQSAYLLKAQGDGQKMAPGAGRENMTGIVPGAGLETGRGTLQTEEVEKALEWAAQHHVQILAHCNGDAAAEQYLQAIAGTERRYPDFAQLRPVMIHAQLLDRDQLPQVRALGVTPSFFVAHVYHWGDAHIRNFGMERASRISPAASALREGIRFTFHQDSPVIEPDMLETVWCAVNRITREGVVLGADERIPVMDALRAVTSNAAWQYGEEDSKGTITPGKQADLVLLDRSPLAVEPEEIRNIRVMRTYKGGEILYERKAAE